MVVLASWVVAVAATLAAWVASEHVVVLGGTTPGRPALALTAFLASLTLAVGHGLSRHPGPMRDAERAAVRGVVIAIAVLSLLGIPIVGFYVFMVGFGLWVALAQPLPVAVIVVAVGVSAGVLQRGEVLARERARAGAPEPAALPRVAHPALRWLASAALSAGVILLTTLAVPGAVFAASDDLLVAHHPGGCTAVVRQSQVLFGGDAILYVASPGSVVASRWATYPLLETLPFPDGDVELEAGNARVRIAFDDGRGPVDEVVPCR